MKHPSVYRFLIGIVVLSLIAPQLLSSIASATQSIPSEGKAQGDAPTAGPASQPQRRGVKSPDALAPVESDQGEDPYGRDDAFYARRVAGDPNVNFTISDAAAKRAEAAAAVAAMQQSQANRPASASGFGGAWSGIGPDPMTLVSRSRNATNSFDYVAMGGRIGALAIRNSPPYTLYLGAAQGGVWVGLPPTNTLATTWTPKTDNLPSLAIGAIALAPSNEDIVYVGTGEGALSGDSYFGNGVLKSVDGGNSFAKISAAGFFTNVSISKIVVDPANPDRLFAATLRGRGGSRRVSPENQSLWGIWESTDGGVNWVARITVPGPITTTTDFRGGATDLVMDPQQPNTLYATFLGQGISKTVDGGVNWVSVMSGLPITASFGVAPSRFAIGISHPSAAVSATLYTGFEWFDNVGGYHSSTVWKSTDEANSWAETNTAVVGGYCGTPAISQCFYDNAIGVDPNDPTIVFALGLFDYTNGRGGVFRSKDGGATWLDMGYNQHPDFHAIAISKNQPGAVVIGSDGGVWYSSDYGGRTGVNPPISAVTWVDLNGSVDPNNFGVALKRSGLQIAQFDSIAPSPSNPNRFYGGTQDNGTLRKASGSNSWFDYPSGDGGQVLLNPIDPLFVFGTYFGIQPYRYDDGFGLTDTPNPITDTHGFFFRSGITLTDRSEFYVPWVLDPDSPNRLYLGTYRVYRSVNGEMPNPPSAQWKAISPDLTSGCLGAAPNGGRGCTISALGVNGGSGALYTGSEEGIVYLSTDATVASPTWTRVDKAPLPARPVAAIAVDNSNYRVAYLAFNGFNAGTPTRPGHVFKTVDAGATWTDVSGDLVDTPVNSLLIDPTSPDTLYAGTDVGMMVTTNGGTNWLPLGTGFPIAAVNQAALNPFTRVLAAATHGRGAWKLVDAATQTPVLQVRKSTGPAPIGPGTLLTYTVTVKNLGNAQATGVVVTDAVPANTSFVSASAGGSLVGGSVVWAVSSVPTPTVNANTGVDPGVAQVSFTVLITSAAAITTGSTITNDGIVVTSAQGVGATGSPFIATVSPQFLFAVAPASQFDGTNAGKTISYTVSLQNLGFSNDTYNLAVSGNAFATTIWNAANTTQINQLAVGSGATGNIVIRVSVPATATNGLTDNATISATSVGNAAGKSVAIATEAITLQLLLVDNDDNAPNVQGFYTATLNSLGALYNIWDLRAKGNVLPTNFTKAHHTIVWFTGGTFPNAFTPYEGVLSAFLDNGGRLFMSSLDGLDQAGGTTPFVHNYLHINWDGSEAQNDKSTDPMTVTAVITNPLFSTLAGSFVVNNASLGYGAFNDWITPISPAQPAFKDAGANQFNGLSVSALSPNTGMEYRVVFVAWPVEALGASDRVKIMSKVLQYLNPIFLPIIGRN